MTNCIFCKIINKEIPATVQYEDEQILAFNDIHPVAETHILIIPKVHIESAMHMSEAHKELSHHMLEVANKLAKEKGLPGYKLHMNVGKEGGQIVMHIHFHLLGGKMSQSCETM